MIDIVTVVFQEELPILRLQAQSIELYCQDIGVKNIYVIVNDRDSVAAEIDIAWWGAMSNLVKIIPRNNFNCSFVENGWVSQQALKMLAASVSNNIWSMVLDAKTLLVDHVKLQQLVDNQGKLKLGTLDIYPVFKPSQQITNQLFGIDLKKQVGPGGVPFFFHNDMIRSMIKYIEQKVNQNFSEWFQAQGMLTEFILYSGWVEMVSGLDKYYSPKSNFKYHNICHSEVGIADIKLKTMNSVNSLVVGVHRNAWKQFSDEQKNCYREILLSRGLTRAKDLV
jgi:hypothetical protein